MKLAVAAAMAATVLIPCSLCDSASAQTYSSQQSAKKKKTTAAVAPAPRHVSPSGNPEWDVYVSGVYVGSDPDPRIRSTLAREGKSNFGMSD